LLLNCRGLHHSVAILVAAASLLCSSILHASEQSEYSIRQGVAAYEAGEYQKALEYFAEAVRLGASQAALYYDIGVTHYKLKQYDQADEAFRIVAQSPKWEPLALYNRALIAYRQNQLELANEYATKSISLSKSPGLVAQNYRLLDRLEKGNQDYPSWSKLVYLGLGYNDNVLFTEAGASSISGEGDTFVDFVGRLRRTFGSPDSKKLKFLVQANLRDYRNLNEYDQMGLRSGLEKELGHPNSAVGAYLEQVLLDGKGYEFITSLEYRQKFASNGKSPLELKYSFNNYSMLDSNYAFLGGVLHRIRLEKERKLEAGSFEAYFQGEYNDREDQTVSGDFYSYSPVHLGFGAIYKKNLSSRRLVSGSVFLQGSRFQDPDVRSGLAKTREDGLLEFRLDIIHVSSTRWVYRASYMGTVNSSNYSEFSYDQNVVSVGIFKSF
jgi:tetratricopeptide (TPR) repeat protein